MMRRGKRAACAAAAAGPARPRRWWPRTSPARGILEHERERARACRCRGRDSRRCSAGDRPGTRGASWCRRAPASHVTTSSLAGSSMRCRRGRSRRASRPGCVAPTRSSVGAALDVDVRSGGGAPAGAGRIHALLSVTSTAKDEAGKARTAATIAARTVRIASRRSALAGAIEQADQARRVPSPAAARLHFGVDAGRRAPSPAASRRCAAPRRGRSRGPCASSRRRSRSRTCRRSSSCRGSPSATIARRPC